MPHRFRHVGLKYYSRVCFIAGPALLCKIKRQYLLLLVALNDLGIYCTTSRTSDYIMDMV